MSSVFLDIHLTRGQDDFHFRHTISEGLPLYDQLQSLEFVKEQTREGWAVESIVRLVKLPDEAEEEEEEEEKEPE